MIFLYMIMNAQNQQVKNFVKKIVIKKVCRYIYRLRIYILLTFDYSGFSETFVRRL